MGLPPYVASTADDRKPPVVTFWASISNPTVGSFAWDPVASISAGDKLLSIECTLTALLPALSLTIRSNPVGSPPPEALTTAASLGSSSLSPDINTACVSTGGVIEWLFAGVGSLVGDVDCELQVEPLSEDC